MMKSGAPLQRFPSNLFFIAYNHEIGLNNGEGSIIQLYIKWSMEHPAWSLFAFEIMLSIVESSMEIACDPAMGWPCSRFAHRRLLPDIFRKRFILL